MTESTAVSRAAVLRELGWMALEAVGWVIRAVLYCSLLALGLVAGIQLVDSAVQVARSPLSPPDLWGPLLPSARYAVWLFWWAIVVLFYLALSSLIWNAAKSRVEERERPAAEVTRPGCQCPSCRAESAVYHFVCHDCARDVEDAIEPFELLVAGQERAEALADAHWHDDVEVGLLWAADDAGGGAGAE